MDLLEDFNTVRSTIADFATVGERVDSTVADDNFKERALPSPSAGYDGPSLTVDVTVRQAARGRGQVIEAACAADTVALVTSKGFLIRYHWDESGTERVTEAELPKSSDLRPHALFLDPSGHHTLVCCRSSSSPANNELLYHHSSFPRPRPLPKIKGSVITAVAWEKQLQPAEAALHAGQVLLGSDHGGLFLQQLDSRAKRDAPAQLLLDWKDTRKALTALEQEVLAPGEGGGRRLVLAATPGSMHMAVGGPGLEGLFSKFPSAAAWTPLMEVTVSSLNSQLHLIRGSDPASLPSRFAWLVGSILCHGHLLLPTSSSHAVTAPSPDATLTASTGKSPGSKAGRSAGASGWLHWGWGGSNQQGSAEGLGEEEEGAEQGGLAEVEEASGYVRDMRQLRLLEDGQPSLPEDEPSSMVPSEYHYLLLYADRLMALNQVSGKVVALLRIRGPAASPTFGGSAGLAAGVPGFIGHPLRLLRDPSSGNLLLATSEALEEVGLANEGKDMWRIYLEHQDYDSALRLAAGPAQRDTVYRTMAEESYASGQYQAAAAQWGKVVGGRPGFEEVTLQLVGCGDPEALQVYLETKLKVLAPADRAQATLVASWLTELLLDRLNRALMEAAGGRSSSSVEQQQQHLRDFLSKHANILDVSTTSHLLATYGRLDELQHYAAVRGDYEGVLDLLMATPGGAAKALGVLRKPGVSTSLVYKYAPALLQALPSDTVDFWVQCGSRLDPRQLLPALAVCGQVRGDPARRADALRYVTFAFQQLRCEDSAVHNLAVALYSLDTNEQPLLGYLGSAKSPLGRPYYDPKSALRLATERGKLRACVSLLCQLGLYQDAVALALTVDLQLAKAVASSPEGEGEEALRRQLWLSIAQHVVQGSSGPQAAAAAASSSGEDAVASIKPAVQLLQEAEGLLKIEDILPFFPDFVVIDHFQAAICDSLQSYNKQIDELKREMDEATDIADAIRRDLALLSNRTGTLPAQEPCAACGRPIKEAPLNHLKLPTGGVIPPFYLYPTGLAFHVVCAAAEVMQYGGEGRAKAVRSLLQRLSRINPSAVVLSGAAGADGAADLLKQLEEEVGCEDPWNGELVVRMVDMPLVDPLADAAEVASWAL